MSDVLVIEDDPAIQRGVADALRGEGYDVRTASDGETGMRMLREQRAGVVVLDLMLPRMSGLEVCRRIRADGSRVGILVLTARGDESDRIIGLDIGADDYMAKPFSVGELLARVRALLRRAEPAHGDAECLELGDIRVDFVRYEARKGERTLDMTRKEFALLRALVGRAGEVVSRDALLRDVWGHTASVATRTVDTHVALLRAKLEDDPAHPRHLLTVHGVGYRWSQ